MLTNKRRCCCCCIYDAYVKDTLELTIGVHSYGRIIGYDYVADTNTYTVTLTLETVTPGSSIRTYSAIFTTEPTFNYWQNEGLSDGDYFNLIANGQGSEEDVSCASQGTPPTPENWDFVATCELDSVTGCLKLIDFVQEVYNNNDNEGSWYARFTLDDDPNICNDTFMGTIRDNCGGSHFNENFPNDIAVPLTFEFYDA